MKKTVLLISFLFVLTGLKIFAQPAPPVTIEAYDILGNPLSNNPTICQFQSIDFNVHIPYENTEPKTFKWKKNGVVVLTQTAVNPAPPTISWNSSSLATGDTISLTVVFTNPPPFYSPDSATSQNIIFTVTPNQPPMVTISHNFPTDTICRGNIITFTATVFDAGTPTYQWYLDGVPVGSASIYNTLSTLAPGNHCVYCEIVSSEYCDTQDPVYNPVATATQICFYIDPCYYYVPASGSLGPYTTCNSPFYDSALDNPVNYSNNVNGMVKFCPAVPSQYLVISFTTISLNDAGDRLRIFPGTTASMLIADTSSTPLFNVAGPVSSVGGPVIASTAPGGCLTAHFRTNSVGNAAGWIANITCSPTSVNEQNNDGTGISIYPNPAKNELIIDNGRWTISNIEIYNTLGEKILDQKQAKNQKQIAIDVSSLRSGIYFIKIRGENAEQITKFMKQ